MEQHVHLPQKASVGARRPSHGPRTLCSFVRRLQGDPGTAPSRAARGRGGWRGVRRTGGGGPPPLLLPLPMSLLYTPSVDNS